MSTRTPARRQAARYASNATGKRRPDDELMTILEMAGEMKVSRRTFYRWKAVGDVPELFPTPGGEFRAWRSDFQAWLLSRAERTHRR